jgi:hypothetical protein
MISLMGVVPRGRDPLLEEARELASKTEGWLTEAGRVTQERVETAEEASHRPMF